jgi:preprotein translocase subunit SecG
MQEALLVVFLIVAIGLVGLIMLQQSESARVLVERSGKSGGTG